MSTDADNTSMVAQTGSVSCGGNHQAPQEPPHLSQARVAAYGPDNVLVRVSSGTTSVALSIEQHRARVQRILHGLEPMLPSQGGNANHNTA